MRRALAVLISVFSVLSAGACALPEGDQSTPEQAYYRYLTVRQSGDLDALWELLHADVRGEYADWHAAEREAVTAIRTRYPKSDRAPALAALGGGQRADLADARALFKQFALEAPEEALGMLTSLGAHARSETLSEDGLSARVRTYGGDELVFVKGGDGQWYATLAADELQRLRNARERAQQNAARVRKNVEQLGGD